MPSLFKKPGGLKPLNVKAELGFEETTVERTCPEHGPYVAKIHTLADADGITRVVHESMCPTCFGLKKQAEEEEAARKAAEMQLAIDRQRIESCLDAMCLPIRYRGMTFETFKAIGDHAEDKARKRLVAESYVQKFDDLSKRGIGLILLGGSGTGKTHLACAILQALSNKAVGLYVTAAEMFDQINETFERNNSRTSAEVKSTFKQVPLLVLDEIGRSKLTPAAQSTLFKVIDARYRQLLPTIFISNAESPDQFAEQIGPAAWDRAQETCKVMSFKWASMRKAPTF